MNTVLLEICANGLPSALAAAAGGADRVELCQHLESGGSTASFGVLATARQLLDIPVHALIRPRAGHFVYDAWDLAVMKTDIETCRQLGIEGVVFGALTPSGKIDMDANHSLAEAASGMDLTFHRAFDHCHDPFSSLEDIISLGFHRVLTSGRPGNALDNIELLEKLIQAAKGRILLMPGGGIRSGNAKKIAARTGAVEIHSSCIPYPLEQTPLTDIKLVKTLKEALST